MIPGGGTAPNGQGGRHGDMSWFGHFRRRHLARSAGRSAADDSGSGVGSSSARQRRSLPWSYFANLIVGHECFVCGHDLTGMLIEGRVHPGGWNVEGCASPQWLYVTCPRGHRNSLQDLGYEPGVFYDQELAKLVVAGDATAVRQELEHGGDANACDLGGAPVLTGAAQFGHAEVVLLLLQAGAEVDATDGEGRTSLHCASLMGHAEIVAALLRAGAEADRLDAEGRTALRCACQYGHLEVAEELLAARADVNMADAKGATSLMMAASYNSDDLASLLLNHGAEVNARDANGETALHLPASRGHARLVRTLMEAGADPSIKNRQGKSALHYARQEGLEEILELLRRRPAPGLREGRLASRGRAASNEPERPAQMTRRASQPVKECLNCGQVIPDGQLECPACGSSRYTWR